LMRFGRARGRTDRSARARPPAQPSAGRAPPKSVPARTMPALTIPMQISLHNAYRRALSLPCRKLKPKRRALRRQMNATPSGPRAAFPRDGEAATKDHSSFDHSDDGRTCRAARLGDVVPTWGHPGRAMACASSRWHPRSPGESSSSRSPKTVRKKGRLVDGDLQVAPRRRRSRPRPRRGTQ
jgi:hypothetical protein